MTGLRQLGYEFTTRADRLDVIDLPQVLQLLEKSDDLGNQSGIILVFARGHAHQSGLNIALT